MSQVWAVARNLVLEVWRIRSLVIFIFLTLGTCTVGMAVWLHYGSGLGDQKIQTYLSYSLSFTSNILALLTIFVSIGTITRDIKRKEIFTIATKPVTRGGYLAGKFLGMAMVNLLLLCFVGLTIYVSIFILTKTEPKTPDEQARLQELILIARQSVAPPLPDVQEQAAKESEAIIEQEIRELNMKDPSAIANMRAMVRHEKANQLALKQRTVTPGGNITWHFSGIQPLKTENSNIYIRYKMDVSPTPDSLAVTGLWSFGPTPDVLHTGERFITRDAIRTVHEFPIPLRALSDQGDLYVAFQNPVENYPVNIIFPLPGREKVTIEALYVVSGFTDNFIRSLAAIFLKLLFLGLIGLAVGCWLSFPVASLFVMVVFIVGLASNFIADAFRWNLGLDKSAVSAILSFFLPRLGAYDPVPLLEKGHWVTNELLTTCLWLMIGVKGGILMFFGYLMFKFRELARVIV